MTRSGGEVTWQDTSRRQERKIGASKDWEGYAIRRETRRRARVGGGRSNRRRGRSGSGRRRRRRRTKNQAMMVGREELEEQPRVFIVPLGDCVNNCEGGVFAEDDRQGEKRERERGN